MQRIKRFLRRLIVALPGGRALDELRYRYLDNRRIARLGGDTERIFLHHYETNEWRTGESASGPGSTIQYTENIRREIPRLVSDLAVQTILDAPCGDYNWLRLVTWERPVTYVGGDIVQPLVERNQSLYGRPGTTFIKIDILHDILPAADLWLCRDCLFHLSHRDIKLVIDNFLRSGIRYLLTSTHSECDKNRDIRTGSFRLLNLRLPPFSFCAPITMIDDWIEGFDVRHLALWNRESLRSSLASNKAFQRMALRRR